MPLPMHVRHDVERKLIAYCTRRVPKQLRKQVKAAFKIRGNAVTLFEDREHFLHKSRWIQIPIAQFRFQGSYWTLYCPDRNSKWHRYPLASPSKQLDVLIAEVEENPIGMFTT